MLNVFARATVSRVVDPLGRGLVRLGVSPNSMTIIGTLGVSASALVFFPAGMLLAGTFAVWFFIMLDVLDGSMARARGRTTAFGAVLDATGDRIADGALFGAIVWWGATAGQSPAAAAGALIALVLAETVPYIKARAEACGLTAGGGLIERAERSILALVGTGLHGFGVAYTVEIAMWVLVALSAITLGQRVRTAYRSGDR